jgi:hypothetical protein
MAHKLKSMFDTHHHVHHHYAPSGLSEEQFLFIKTNLTTMSQELNALQAQVTALNEKADALQAAIDADQAADAEW